MIIIGSKGHALDIISELESEEIVLFDNISNDIPSWLLEKVKLINTQSELEKEFKKKTDFILGMGDPAVRKYLADKMRVYGGNLCSFYSKSCQVGFLNMNLKSGLNIMPNTFISNNVSIGEGSLINSFSSIHHDCIIGNYVEISPGARILGRVEIGDYSIIGSNANILPDVKIGSNVIIGAGAVITNNVEDSYVVVGVPGKKLKRNKAFNERIDLLKLKHG